MACMQLCIRSHFDPLECTLQVYSETRATDAFRRKTSKATSALPQTFHADFCIALAHVAVPYMKITLFRIPGR